MSRPRRQGAGRSAAPWILLSLALVVGGCQDPVTPTSPSAPTPPVLSASFVVSGDPAAPTGAGWTYTSTEGGVSYELRGILLRPAGNGPFPAVILSHGLGENVDSYARRLASEMVTWGLVVIATNYTHAGGVAPGAPGTLADLGASEANVQRASKLIELLGRLGYVDLSRVAAHGHSAGAFVTAAFAAAQPSRLRAASITAGGVALPPFTTQTVATSEAQAQAIRVPVQLHHGDRDLVVPLPLAQRLAAILRSNGVPHELTVYPGEGHDIGDHPAMLTSVRGWYGRHGVLR